MIDYKSPLIVEHLRLCASLEWCITAEIEIQSLKLKKEEEEEEEEETGPRLKETQMDWFSGRRPCFSVLF